jgi:hypothetical protein
MAAPAAPTTLPSRPPARVAWWEPSAVEVALDAHNRTGGRGSAATTGR